MGENKEYVTHPDEKGSINISDEVVASIAANAAMEVEGVASLPTAFGKEIAEKLGFKSAPSGVKLRMEPDGITAEVFVTVESDAVVNETAKKVQENVVAQIESMTGFSVKAVNVHICGISFEKK